MLLTIETIHPTLFCMKLTLQLQLLPTPEQATLLMNTMAAFNAAASHAAQVGFDAKVYGQPGIHKRCYYHLREAFGLSAQMAVRAIAKAVEIFKRDKTRCPVFRPDGAITYDDRILGWKGLDKVSLWTLQGREIVPMVYGQYQSERFDRLKGQVDLVSRDGKFYLYATIETPEDAPITPTRFLGVDLGIAHLLTDSDGHTEPGDTIEHTRQRRQTARDTYQARGTKSANRRLKKMAGKQQRFQRWVNHGLAKRLVQYAKDTKAVLVLEELTHIRRRITVRKRQRAKHSNWSFRQLRDFVIYKATQAGIPWLLVDPRYTSQTCSKCGFRDKRNRRSQAEFSCLKCGFHIHADLNAAKNLAGRALVSAPDLIAPAHGQLALHWQ
jgi:putative transposase